MGYHMKVKFNLKLFIEEYVIAKEAHDTDAIEELEEKFVHFCSTVTEEVKKQSIAYILRSKLIQASGRYSSFFEKI